MKKLLIVLSLILSLSLCLFACGEGESTMPELEESVAEVIAFTENSLSVELYESATLSVQGSQGKALTWRSANPSRVDVDQNGVVFAKLPGTAIVYCSDGTTEIACTVTVINSGYVPTLELDVPTNFTIENGDTYPLNPHIAYNGVKYFNAEYTYTASWAVSVSASGVITANSVGTGTVTISAKWNGAEFETLVVSFDVIVV